MPRYFTSGPERWRVRGVLLLTVFMAATSGGAAAQGIALFKKAGEAGAASSAAIAVPDPAALKAGWWDYLALDQPDAEARVGALLGQAAASMARLPGEHASAAGEALERLRISLSALPGMLSARPATLPDLPQSRPTYTTRAILDLDREVRDLQEELDERRSAVSVAERAIKNGQRQADTAFAAYLAGPAQAPIRSLDGLRIMATRAEIAVMEAELGLRGREINALRERIRAMSALRDEGRGRIVSDPERPAARLGELIAENHARLETQRSEILRERARRSEIASRGSATKTEISLADIRMLADMIEEGVFATRIALYETELDWLAITGEPDPSYGGIADLDRRLEQRRIDLGLMDQDVTEWVAEIERLISGSLRARASQASGYDQATRDALLDAGRKAILRLNRLRSLQDDVRFAIGVTADLVAEGAGWRGWLRTRVVKPGAVAAQRANELLGASLFSIGGAPVTAYGLLRVILIMAAAVLLSRVARHLVIRIGARQKGSASAGIYTVNRLLHYVLITAGLMIGLSSIGLDFSQLALVAGALSIGIGFGLQSVVNNFVSGLMILFEQSLTVGDVVELDSGVRGTVREIRVRSTLITTSDGVDIVVPNSEFVAGKVINFTHREPYHRIHVPFGVAYDSDKDKVRAVVVAAAREVPITHERAGREPDVWLVRFGDNSLDFELVVWIDPAAVTRPGSVNATYLWAIESALRENGIEIPFPQRDVRVRLSGADAAAIAAGSPPPPR